MEIGMGQLSLFNIEAYEVRRAHLRAELDAYFARLYDLTRDIRATISIQKSLWGGFPWRDVPCAEREGSKSVWRVSDTISCARCAGLVI